MQVAAFQPGSFVRNFLHVILLYLISGCHGVVGGSRLSCCRTIVSDTACKGLLVERHKLEFQANELRADLGGIREHEVRKFKWVSLDALSLCHRQFEPFCAPRWVAVMQQPCWSVVHMVGIGCKSCTPTVLTSTRKSHLSSPNQCYHTTLQRLFNAQFGLQMAAFDVMHPRSDCLLL